MKRREPALTAEQLQLAFRHLHRPGWPETLEDTLAHPVRGNCVRGLARQLSRPAFNSAGTRAPAHSLPQLPAPSTPSAPPVPRSAQRRGERTPLGAWPAMRLPANTFDARKAAANDLKDD